MLYIFSGSQHMIAVTTRETGDNLPAEFAPWKFLRSAEPDDASMNAGVSKGTVKEVREKGYALRQVRVTFEPVSTQPINPPF